MHMRNIARPWLFVGLVFLSASLARADGEDPDADVRRAEVLERVEGRVDEAKAIYERVWKDKGETGAGFLAAQKLLDLGTTRSGSEWIELIERLTDLHATRIEPVLAQRLAELAATHLEPGAAARTPLGLVVRPKGEAAGASAPLDTLLAALEVQTSGWFRDMSPSEAQRAAVDRALAPWGEAAAPAIERRMREGPEPYGAAMLLARVTGDPARAFAGVVRALREWPADRRMELAGALAHILHAALPVRGEHLLAQLEPFFLHVDDATLQREVAKWVKSQLDDATLLREAERRPALWTAALAETAHRPSKTWLTEVVALLVRLDALKDLHRLLASIGSSSIGDPSVEQSAALALAMQTWIARTQESHPGSMAGYTLEQALARLPGEAARARELLWDRVRKVGDPLRQEFIRLAHELNVEPLNFMAPPSILSDTILMKEVGRINQRLLSEALQSEQGWAAFFRDMTGDAPTVQAAWSWWLEYFKWLGPVPERFREAALALYGSTLWEKKSAPQEIVHAAAATNDPAVLAHMQAQIEAAMAGTAPSKINEWSRIWAVYAGPGRLDFAKRELVRIGSVHMGQLASKLLNWLATGDEPEATATFEAIALDSSHPQAASALGAALVPGPVIERVLNQAIARTKADARGFLGPTDPPWYRIALANLILRQGEEAGIPVLLAIHRDGGPAQEVAGKALDEFRARAERVAWFRQWGESPAAAEDQLLSLLNDPHDGVVGEAIAALGAVGGMRAMSALLELARSERAPGLREKALRAVARIGERDPRRNGSPAPRAEPAQDDAAKAADAAATR